METKTGKTIPAAIEPKETYRHIEKVITHAPKQITAAEGISPINIPSAVSTPFPPLKWANTVQICPMTAEKPAIICMRV